MEQSFTTETLSELFGYPFKDPKWVSKILIGSFLMFFGFLILPIFFIYGYFFEILKGAVAGAEPTLPEWDQWERKFIGGAKLFAAIFIYLLPFIVLIILAYVLIFAGSFGAEFATYSGDPNSFLWPIAALFGSFAGIVLFAISMLLGIAAGLVLPVVMGHVVAKDEFMAAFRVGEWWKIFRANTSGFLISYLIVIGSILLMNFATQILNMTVILCCLTPFISGAFSFYLMTVANVLFGQAYRIGVQNLS